MCADVNSLENSEASGPVYVVPALRSVPSLPQDLMSLPDSLRPAVPASAWQRSLPGADDRPRLNRPRLTQRVLQSPAKWVSIIGMPTTGRSVLLEQLFMSLAVSKMPTLASWTFEQSNALLDSLRNGPDRGVTVLIDDFDLAASPEQLYLELNALVRRDPTAKIVTVSVNPVVHEPAPCTNVDACEFIETIPSVALHFTHDEIRSLYLLFVALRGADFLSDADIDLATDRISDASMGVAFPVRIAIAEFLDSGPSEAQLTRASSLPRSIQALQMHMVSAYPVGFDQTGVIGSFGMLSLMPRFTQRHVQSLFPKLTPLEVSEIATQVGLDPVKSQRGFEYAWADPLWQLFTQWHFSNSLAREQLASALESTGEYGPAFDQRVLARDYARSERMLQQRFFTIYETLAPEAAGALLDTGSTELDPYPVLSALKALLDPALTADRAAEHAERLQLSQAHPDAPAHPVVTAVRATLEGKAGRSSLAREAAQFALDSVARLTNSESHAFAGEAALLAMLTMLENGGFPSTTWFTHQYPGSHYLQRRRTILFSVISHAHSAQRPTAQESLAQADERNELGFRYLAFSPRACASNVTGFRTLDEAFTHSAQPYRTAPGPDPSTQTSRPLAPPTVFGPIADYFLQLLDSGALTDAGESSSQYLAEPFENIRRSIHSLALGDSKGALAHTSQIDSNWGERISALRDLIQAVAQIQAGNEGAARLVLQRTGAVSDIALAQALSVLTESDGARVAALSSRFSQLHEISKSIGMLGTGRLRGDLQVLKPLTRAELKVLKRLGEGLNTSEIAAKEHVSVGTVRSHVKHIAKKFDVSGQAAILQRAADLGLLTSDRP